jgi:hypothetical protein
LSKLLIFSFACCISLHLNAQDKILPNEAKQFVEMGYEMMDYITGDLNSDKKADAILILKAIGEDTLTEEVKRPMLILLRQTDGTLKQERRNDNIILCRQCGGVFGDPYENVEINNNAFSIHFYGGSAWRWSREYRFKYDPKLKDWFIEQETESTYWNVDPDDTFNSIVIPAQETGIVSFEKYVRDDLENVQFTKWKVNVLKTYFYDTAKVNSKPLKAYLIKGDKIESYRETKNFVLVDYKNVKEKYTRGFIRKKDLTRQE